MALGRDDGPCATRGQPSPQIVAVIAFVGDEVGRWRQGFDAGLGNPHVVHVARCQQQDERAAFDVADGMELGVAAAPARAATMGQGPPFAPPAVRWTLMRSEEHTSELQSLMPISYAVFCLQKK